MDWRIWNVYFSFAIAAAFCPATAAGIVVYFGCCLVLLDVLQNVNKHNVKYTLQLNFVVGIIGAMSEQYRQIHQIILECSTTMKSSREKHNKNRFCGL